MLIPALLAAASCSGAPCTAVIFPRRSVVLGSDRVMLGDIADLAVLPAPLRAKAARLVLVRLGKGNVPADVPAAPLFAKARVLLPALADWLPENPGGMISISVKHVAAASKGRNCLAAKRDLNESMPARSADFVEAECLDTAPARTFGYASGTMAVRTLRPISAGDIVPRYAGFGEAMIPAGESLVLRSVSGPVVVQRPVVVAKSVRAGQRAFVRTSDGTVLSVVTPGLGQ